MGGEETVTDLPGKVQAPVQKFWWYCQEQLHPGVQRFDTQPLDPARIFSSDTDEGCPVCPGCDRQVNAIPCDGSDKPPQSVIEYAARVAQR